MSERFWSKVQKGPGCWRWSGAFARNGYGMFRVSVDGVWRMRGAHRVAWVLANGEPIPDGFCVCHSCDNRWCVNPEHLFLGSVADNNADMKSKGRSAGNTTRGEARTQASLSDRDVVEIRRIYSGGGVRQIDLATRFGVSQSHVSSIVRKMKRT